MSQKSLVFFATKRQKPSGTACLLQFIDNSAWLCNACINPLVTGDSPSVRLGSWESTSSWCASSSRERKMGCWTARWGSTMWLHNPWGDHKVLPPIIVVTGLLSESQSSNKGSVCFRSRIIWCIFTETYWRRKWQRTPLFLRIPWTEEPGGLQSMGLQRAGHDWVAKPPSQISIPDILGKE